VTVPDLGVVSTPAIRATSTTGLTVDWDLPEHTSCEVTTYTVQVCNEGGDVIQSFETAAQVTTRSFEGLSPGTAYTARVRALAASSRRMRRSAHDGVTRPDSPVRSDSPARPESPLFGHAAASTTFQLCSPSWSPWAQSSNGEPRVTLPLTGIITQPRLYLASASSICMTWQPPEQTACTISKFELQLCEVGGAPIGQVVPVAAETTLHVFEQLESGKEYSAYFSTEARHANGFLVPATEHSELAAAVTVPAVGVVTDLELKPENESSFDATWVVPTTIACTLIEYQVALCDKNGASLGDNHTVPNSSHRFVDVASGSTFTARVMARAQATGGPDGTSTFTLQAAWSQAPHPVTLSDPEWSLFLVYWRKVKIWDFVEAATAENVKMVFWNHWRSIKFIFLSFASTGHTQGDFAMASIDKQEFMTLLKASKVCGAGTSTGMSGNDVDVDFAVVNNHYESHDSKKGALKLYEFMDMLIRVSLKLAKPARPKMKRAQTSANLSTSSSQGRKTALLDTNLSLPGCLDELLDAYIVKHQGVLIDKDQMMGRYLMSPVVQQVFATHEEQIYGIFNGVRNSDQGSGSNPLVSVSEWLTIFKKHPIKDFSRSEMIMCFALSQEISKDQGLATGVEDQLVQVIDFYEFAEAMARAAYATLPSKHQRSDKPEEALKAFATRLGPLIAEIGAEYKPATPPPLKRLNERFAAFISGSELRDEAAFAEEFAAMTGVVADMPTIKEGEPRPSNEPKEQGPGAKAPGGRPLVSVPDQPVERNPSAVTPPMTERDPASSQPAVPNPVMASGPPAPALSPAPAATKPPLNIARAALPGATSAKGQSSSRAKGQTSTRTTKGSGGGKTTSPPAKGK